MEIFYFPLIYHGDVTLSQEEMDFFEAIKYNSEQTREKFNVHVTLNDVAHDYACQMANEDFFSHIDSQGVTANERVINAGIDLPYATPGNNIESIAAGYTTVQDATAGLFASDRHFNHLSGQGFFNNQINIGVGHCFNKNSKYRNYWVFLSIP